jgi:hypothetical protein
MFWSSHIRTELTVSNALAAASSLASNSGLPFALHTQGMRANEQSGYAPASSRGRC